MHRNKIRVGLLFLFWLFGCGDLDSVDLSVPLTSTPKNEDLRSSAVPPESSNATDRVCWGDLHGHTIMSDGHISPQEYFKKARDEAKIDFVSITDHVYYPPRPNSRLNKDSWKAIQRIAAFFHQPGKFVTFTGFEWSTSEGHFTGYVLGNDAPIFPDLFPNTLDDISELIARGDGLLHVAHPTTGPGGVFDILRRWQFGHLTNVTNVEIVGHKGFQFEEGYREFLSKGMKVGVIGVSDAHRGPPGFGGLTAVLVRSCTQEEILKALRVRRNYASTGERAEFVFKADGHWMGEEYTPSSQPLLTIEVKASTIIASIKILRDETTVFVRDPGSSIAHLEYKDEDWSPGTPHYYRVNVVMKNGQLLWSSPIWTK